jgi:hypothetical protein
MLLRGQIGHSPLPDGHDGRPFGAVIPVPVKRRSVDYIITRNSD